MRGYILIKDRVILHCTSACKYWLMSYIENIILPDPDSPGTDTSGFNPQNTFASILDGQSSTPLLCYVTMSLYRTETAI